MAYTSIEALITEWAENREIRNISRGDICALAEMFSDILEPYRTLYRALDAQNISELIRDARYREREL